MMGRGSVGEGSEREEVQQEEGRGREPREVSPGLSGMELGVGWGVRRAKGVASVLNLHRLGPWVCQGMTSGN